MTKSSTKINFLIDHIDPLGQGVFKQENNIYFIPKTLPEESGTAIVHKKKKGVHFATLENLVKHSDKRISPACPHYEQCSGCHFLHCDYQTEMAIKKATFTRMLTQLRDGLVPNIISAPQRLEYRNRIQLHYDKKLKKLGFIENQRHRIFEIPECHIAMPLVGNTLKKLYYQNHWMDLAKGQPAKGHLEIYERDGKVTLAWNQKYSHGGFTQVFNEMNLKLIQMVTELNPVKSSDILLDLFGGNGNLSQHFQCCKYILDYYTKPQQEENFIHLDLLSDKALDIFQKKTQINQIQHLLIDPPRKGFEQLNQWAQSLNPKTITYVSCHPATMFRDLKKLEGYQVTKAFLIDLFPSTFHFEACLYLEKI